MAYFQYFLKMENRYENKEPTALVAKLELLAFYVFRGGLAERLNASGCKPVDGVTSAAQGSESLPRRQNCNYTLAEALTSARARTAQPKPHESDNLSIRLFGYETQQEISL